MSSILNQVREGLLKGIPLFHSAFGFSFDYTASSLKQMENQFNKMYPLGHEPRNSTLVMGFYLGEVITKSIEGAEWNEPNGDEESANPFAWGIKIPANSGTSYVAFPIQRMANFWFDRTDTLYGYLSMFKDLSTGVLDPENSTGHVGDGYTFKVTKKKPEEIVLEDDKFRMNVALSMLDNKE